MLIPFKYLFARYGIHAPGCVHIGSHFAEELEEYRAHGIEKIVWIEALPEAFEKLLIRVGKYPGQWAIQACVSDKDGEKVKFNVASNEGQSSSFLEFGTHSVAHPTVRFTHQIEMTTTRVDTLFRKHGIGLGFGWFLNIDLQGCDLLALKGMGKLIDHFDYVYIEINEKPLYIGCALVGEVDDYLGAHGFKRVETKMAGSAGWGDALFIRK